MGFFNRLAHGLSNGWNAFMGRDPTNLGRGYSIFPDRPRYSKNGERSIISSIYTRIAIDVAAIDMKHVVVDQDKRYLFDKDSGLNTCLCLRANIDQTGRAFRQSLTMSLLDEGTVVALPFVVDGDIKELRVAKVLEWYPFNLKVRAYNPQTGMHQDVIVPKERVAVVVNPFYAVMNEYNSTAQRLIRKLNMLDALDEQACSGKLNLIIQLPYVVKSEARKKQAEARRQEIEAQLTQSKYGIAYTDGTERITQLNRAIENNLLAQIEYYQKMLYSQLGMTQEIFDGTANEETRLGYYSATVEPILAAIADSFAWSFLSKTARTQGQAVRYFRDPFRLLPLSQFAEVAGKLKQAEVVSANELRQNLGYRPDSNPRSDELVNSNINTVSEQSQGTGEEGDIDMESPDASYEDSGGYEEQ